MADEEVSAELPDAIADALELIRKHAHVLAARVVSHDVDKGLVTIGAEVDTRLPSRWRADGASPKGVLPTEEVAFRFDRNFPFRPPKIYLRADFPRDLPHIQPGDPGGPVEPCVFFGDPGDLMHRRGFEALVEHLARWLERAGSDELTNQAQGWEPIRRDFCDHIFEYDWSAIAALVGADAGSRLVLCSLLTLGEDLGNAYYGVVGAQPVPLTTIVSWFGEDSSRAVIQTTGVVCWSKGPPRGDPVIADRYLPDTVSTLAALLELATAYGCDAPLRDALASIEHGLVQAGKGLLPILVILCARRPTTVIGTNSSLELIPYLIQSKAKSLLKQAENIKVIPVSHRHKVTPDLLFGMSGLPSGTKRRNVSMIGCGSLGSKLAIHLSRAGMAPTLHLDKNSMSPHNAARHALLPNTETRHPEWYGGKAKVLARAVAAFGSPTRYLQTDLLTLAPTSKGYEDVFSGTDLVVNSTGSAAVRAYLNVHSFAARVAEASLLQRGQFGLLTIEGEGRNPATGDLFSEAIQIMAAHSGLRAALAPAEAASVATVGIGCASLTMVMCDALLSLHGAAMGQRLLAVVKDGMPPEGEVLVGQLCEDGMSLTWSKAAVPPVQVVLPENMPGWTLRIAQRAHQKMHADVAKHPDVETGGAIIGRVSMLERVIWITDVLDAPADSVRRAVEFRLGIDGLGAAIAQIQEHSSGALYCVGTWHSHLRDQGGSPRDYLTARELGSSSPIPLALLISRPSGYSAVLTQPKDSA